MRGLISCRVYTSICFVSRCFALHVAAYLVLQLIFLMQPFEVALGGREKRNMKLTQLHLVQKRSQFGASDHIGANTSKH